MDVLEGSTTRHMIRRSRCDYLSLPRCGWRYRWCKDPIYWSSSCHRLCECMELSGCSVISGVVHLWVFSVLACRLVFKLASPSVGSGVFLISSLSWFDHEMFLLGLLLIVHWLNRCEKPGKIRESKGVGFGNDILLLIGTSSDNFFHLKFPLGWCKRPM